MWSLDWQGKFILALSGTIVIAILFYAYFSEQQFEASVVAQFQQHQLAIANSATRGILERLHHIKAGVSQLAKEPGIKGSDTSRYSPALQRTFERLGGVVQGLYRLDTQGVILMRYPLKEKRLGEAIPERVLLYETLATPETVTIGSLVETLDDYIFSVIAPVLKDGAPVGAVRAVVNLRAIAKAFVLPIRQTENGYAFLMSDVGLILYHPRKEHIGETWGEIGRGVFSKGFPWDKKLPAYLRVYQYPKDGAGGAVELVAFRPVEVGGQRLVLAVVSPREDIAGPVIKNKRRTWGYTYLLLVLVVLLAYKATEWRNQRVSLEQEKRHLVRERELADEVRATKTYLSTLLESSPDAIISTDREGNITFFSPGAEALLGYRQEDIIGRNVVELYESEERAKGVMRKMREGGGSVAGLETILRAKDGSLIQVMISASLLYDEDGQEAGTVGFNKDLRERKQSEGRYRTLVESSPGCIMLLDLEGNIIECNSAAVINFGRGRKEDLIGQNLILLFSEENRPNLEEALGTVRQGREARQRFETGTTEGTSRWWGITINPITDEAGRLINILFAGRDITRRVQDKEAVRNSEARLAGILDIADDAIISVDEAHRITLFNQGAEKIFGYRAKEVLGKALNILLPERFSEADPSRMYDGAPSPFRSLGMGDRGAIIGRRKDNTEFPAETSVSMLELGGEKVFTAILRDVSERQEMERKMEALATTDALTKLYNRAYFTSKLEEEFQRAERYNAHLSLMLIDIDHFKSVNDTYGHQAGDAYLEAVAGLVASSVRQVDTVARYGGEELAVILPSTNLSEAMVLADRLRERVEALDVSYGGHAIRRTISIGVASLTEGSANSTVEFLTAADRALYMAKRGGRNLVVLYRDGMDLTFSKLTI